VIAAVDAEQVARRIAREEMQRAAAEYLVVERADGGVRLHAERMAERKCEAAGRNALAVVGGAAALHA
jgi:hypothetical protein